VAIVCEDYLGTQISKENFVDVQQAISRLVNGLPEEGFTPRLVDSYWAEGAAIMVCQNEENSDWLAARVPTLVAWKGSTLKMLGLDSLPKYKRVVTRFPGPVEDTEQYFQWLRRLNRGLDTGHWRVYEHREEPKGVRLVLCIDKPPLLHWRG
jgi:hypothetical protein